MPWYCFVLVPICVDAVIAPFAKHPPAIFLEEFYQVFLFHRLTLRFYYTHLMRIGQAELPQIVQTVQKIPR